MEKAKMLNSNIRRKLENHCLIANGRDLILSSENYAQKEAEIRKRVNEETLWEWSLSPWWQKPFLKWKMKRRIQRELDRLAPPDALYLHTTD
jgi:hypothetical protein